MPAFPGICRSKFWLLFTEGKVIESPKRVVSSYNAYHKQVKSVVNIESSVVYEVSSKIGLRDT